MGPEAMTWKHTYGCLAIFWALSPLSVHAFEMPFANTSHWVQELQKRHLSNYFPGWEHDSLSPAQKHALKHDLQALLNQYTKAKHTQDDEMFFHGWLAPEVERLDASALRLIPEGYLKPIGEFTNDEFLAFKLWQYWMRKPEAAQDPRVLLQTFSNAVQEQRLSGMSTDGWNVLLRSARSIAEFAGQTAWMLTVVGPATVAMNALTEPVVGPISQKFKQLGQAWFGGISEWITKKVSKKESTAFTANGSKKITFLNQALHGTNAAQTAIDQAKNLDRLIEVYTGMQRTYGQVFIDNVHSGRSLLNAILKEEVGLAAQLQMLDSATRIQSLEREAVLNPFMNKLVAEGRFEERLELQRLIREYRNAIALKEPSQLTYESLHRLKTDVVPEFNKRFAKFGLNEEFDLSKLFQLEMKDWQVTLVKASCLAVQNIIDLGKPEGNRSAKTNAQRMTTTVRHWGQQAVEMAKHGPLVKHIMNLMGFDATGDLTVDWPDNERFNKCLEEKIGSPSKEASCEAVVGEPEQRKFEEQHQRLAQVLLTSTSQPIFAWIDRFKSQLKREEVASILADWMLRTKSDDDAAEEHLRNAIANCIDLNPVDTVVN